MLAAASFPDGNNVTGGDNPVQIQPEPATTAKKARQKVESVTIADFYLRDGKPLSGKLVSDDKNQIVIEEFSEGKIVTATYSKREVDTRTVSFRTIPESRYYTELAEHFAAQTWDFRDDPDDFISAIRCYENAKEAARRSGADETAIGQALEKVIKDREVWIRETESRARLRKMEFEAELEKRLKAIEKQQTENSAQLTASKEYFDKTAADVKDSFQKTNDTIGQLNKDFVQQIRRLEIILQEHAASINDLWVVCTWRRPGPPSGG